MLDLENLLKIVQCIKVATYVGSQEGLATHVGSQEGLATRVGSQEGLATHVGSKRDWQLMKVP